MSHGVTRAEEDPPDVPRLVLDPQPLRIVEFQAVQFMLADMATDLALCEAWLWHVARMVDTGAPDFGESRVDAAIMDSIRNRMISVYDYDPGSYEGYIHETDNDKLLLKLDWNVNPSNVSRRYENGGEVLALAVQLYAARSAASWGIGDLADLRSLAEWSADRGAGFVAVSPLGAPNPGPQPEPSPYYPSTRRFGSPLHVDLRGLAPGVDLGDLETAALALDAERIIDDEVEAEPHSPMPETEALERGWRYDRDQKPIFRSRYDDW